MKRIAGIISFVVAVVFNANAQDDHHHIADTTQPAMQMADTMQMDHMNMDEMDSGKPVNHQMNMSNAYSLHLPMSRNGSGTGWLPDASPMYGYMFHSPKWMYMLHGNFFLRYNNQDFSNKGSRGNSEVDAPDWLMFMGQRQVGKNGLFHFSTMISLDAPLGGSSGYPLLFQSGETYNGSRLVDRQHPHDFVSAISVGYTHMVNKDVDITGYFGNPCETCKAHSGPGLKDIR